MPFNVPWYGGVCGGVCIVRRWVPYGPAPIAAPGPETPTNVVDPIPWRGRSMVERGMYGSASSTCVKWYNVIIIFREQVQYIIGY